MHFKVILFDFDGTLVDSLPLILKSFKTTMQQMNIPFNKDEVLKTVGLPLKDICHRFAGERGPEMFDRYIEYQKTIHDLYLKEYSGTGDILNYLKSKGYLLGIVTSKRRQMAKKGIKLVGFDRIIDVLVALEDAPGAKPGAEPVLTALKLLGKTPDQGVYVGDSPFDIRCGKKAGVQTVGVTWGISSRKQLEAEEPDIIIDNWQQLLDFLEKRKP